MEILKAAIKIVCSLKYQSERREVSLIFGVRKHETWHSLKFWQKLFEESISLEIRLHRSKTLKSRKYNSLPQLEAASKEEMIVENKLAECMNYMLMFGASPEIIKRFVNANGRIYLLSTQQINDMLVVFLLN